jgi:hypothetical protein
MKKKEKNAMNKLKKLGFKKVPGTSPGFHMYELTPARLDTIKAHDQQPLTTKEYNKIKAPSSKPQATSRKQQALDKVK